MLLPKDIEKEIDMVRTTFIAQMILKYFLKSSSNTEIVKEILKLGSKYASNQG